MIVNDPGGSIVQHAFAYTLLALKGTFFKVVYCASACIMAIETVPMKQVCVYQQAWFGYHTSTVDANGNEATSTMRWERGREWIERGYKECTP